MSEEYLNIYQAGRKATDLTQEQAAECLAVSVESLKAYELGLRVPPNSVVYGMIEIYRVPWLALLHVQQTSGVLGVLPEGIRIQPLPMAAIQFCNRIFDFADRHRDRELLQIAEDGVIDAAERPRFDAIVQDLSDIIRAAYQLKYTVDQEAHYAST